MNKALLNATIATVHDLPDETDVVLRVNAAAGYLELAMPEECLRELGSLSLGHRWLPAVLHLELIALMGMKRYGEALHLACKATVMWPRIAEFYIHAGSALTWFGRIEEARALWDSAPLELRHTGFFHLNVAWCEMESGNFKCAKSHLEKAICLDASVCEFANQDPQMRRLLFG